MCQRCLDAAATHRVLGRRSILQLAAAAVAGLALAPQAVAKETKAQPKPQNVISPDAAVDRLVRGNNRYVEGVSKRHDFKHEREALSTGQNPYAAILSCADSRIAPEYCFDSARGDLFVCRIAGNFASDEVVASLEYAVQVLNTPLIMVLGHEACGAVDAAIKSVKDGTALPGHLPSLVAAIKPAVDAVKNDSGDMLMNAIRRNVSLNVDKLKNAAPILKSFADDKKIRVVGGIYKLKSGKVELMA
ncbi:MAG TPA: carbonic anhydrase [Xanthobacteraceae bacterium]|jgi:carbonic anhydrase|nr:carbonic anhydrase [Xanthobacteraceae bacterium]